ncbi:MAG TPA: hypothetical protein VGI16_05925 [Candidatus Acidoferrum sp.]
MFALLGERGASRGVGGKGGRVPMLVIVGVELMSTGEPHAEQKTAFAGISTAQTVHFIATGF